MMKEIPVYLFTGFLESGKTQFIQGTLEDERFNSGEKTLLLLCEEGEEEFDPSRFSGGNINIVTIESQDEIEPKRLEALRKKYSAERVIIEYNGMWMISDLYEKLPAGWVMYQQMMFAQANTFVSYNQNMRQLTVDKLQGCEVVIFNRTDDSTDKELLHKIVRGTSRRTDILYEQVNGEVLADETEDPLPFDINAPIIEIADVDYALWFRDLMDDLEKYNGKTVRFTGVVARDKKRMPPEMFAIGRHIMTCCEADITYIPMLCYTDKECELTTNDWIKLVAKISIEKNKFYTQKGPILRASSIERTQPPEQQVATFF